MKRINPATNKPFRCGDIHPETNQIFRGYDKGRLRKDGTFVELWICPASFHAIRDRMRERARARRSKDAFKRTKTSRELIDALEAAPVKASSGGFHNRML
jgi:hypothetical protein